MVCLGGVEMNNKYIFNDMDWIVTSGEIKITPLHGTRPMHHALSKKLYDQNIIKHCKMALSRHGWSWTLPISFHRITATTTTIDKYTIVELTHNNKHYHGLASRADCDKDNAVSGIAVAYHRAFDKMMEIQK